MDNIPEPVSFDTALEKFIKNLETKSRSSATRIAYASDLNQLADYMKNKRITQATSVSPQHLQEYIEYLNSQGYTAKSVSRKINSMKTFFRFLKSEKIIGENPARDLAHPKYEIKPPRILSSEEYKALRDVVRLDIRVSTIIEILLQTGMRISELANLRLDDIKKNELHIREVENNPARDIPITKSASTAISNYLNIRPDVADDHLFVTKTGRPLLIRNIRTSIDRYFKKAGLKDVKVNDLRHTFIAHQLKNGVATEVVHKHVGHKRLSSTQKYLEFLEVDIELTVTRIIEL